MIFIFKTKFISVIFIFFDKIKKYIKYKQRATKNGTEVSNVLARSSPGPSTGPFIIGPQILGPGLACVGHKPANFGQFIFYF